MACAVSAPSMVWPASSPVHTRGLSSETHACQLSWLFARLLPNSTQHPTGACEASKLVARGSISPDVPQSQRDHELSAQSLMPGLTDCREPLQIVLLCTHVSHPLGCGTVRRLIGGNWHSVAPASASSCRDAERLTSDGLNIELRPAQRPSLAPQLPSSGLLPCMAAVCNGQHAAYLLD